VCEGAALPARAEVGLRAKRLGREVKESAAMNTGDAFFPFLFFQFSFSISNLYFQFYHFKPHSNPILNLKSNPH
jgi:hypothetical protein